MSSLPLPHTSVSRRSDDSGCSLPLRLKTETREEHLKLEAELDLLAPGLDADRYRRIMERFYGLYEPWERLLQRPLGRFLPGFAEARSKTPALVEDLSALGSRRDTIAICSQLPSCEGLVELLGCLYVREGATLGGQVIARRVQQELGWTRQNGAAFFSGYGPETGRMWREFQHMLVSLTPAGAEDDVIWSARQTFRSIERWFRGAAA